LENEVQIKLFERHLKVLLLAGITLNRLRVAVKRQWQLAAIMSDIDLKGNPRGGNEGPGVAGGHGQAMGMSQLELMGPRLFFTRFQLVTG
jgi:hypothetical protein